MPHDGPIDNSFSVAMRFLEGWKVGDDGKMMEVERRVGDDGSGEGVGG